MPRVHGNVKRLPPKVTVPGMFIDRKKYLFDNIRQFCSTEESAILTCPEPARGEGPPTKRKKGKDASTAANPTCPEPARGEGPPTKRKKGKDASTAANPTCPVPARGEAPSTKHKKGNNTAIQIKTSKSRRKCSNCRKAGHTKTVHGKITCPDLL